jgi:hypothetical protein
MEEDRRGEDEWFRHNEQQLLEAARVAREKREAERAREEKEEDRKRLRDLHYMKCPKDGHDMQDEELEGVRLDRCTYCEGIFFDAGELDQLFTRRDEKRKGFFRKLIKI